MKFEDMNLDPGIIQSLHDMGIVSPTKIQEESIPRFLKDQESHIIGQAKTGSGKTLAFAIPMAQLINRKLHKVQAVIIVPTRELCKQVAEVFDDLGKKYHFRTVQVYGGVSIDRQIDLIRKGAQIVVATPGRLIDIYKRGQISFNNVQYVALDEADRCLDMGFLPDIEYILLTAMKNVQPRLMLYSATIFKEVYDLAKKFTHGKNIIQVDVSRDRLTVENCDQFYYLVEHFKNKYYHFVRILRKERPRHCMIFVNTKKTGDWLFNRLKREKKIPLHMELISGNLSQKRREIVLDKFRKKKINCLIATDVAARGLDIDKVSHVFNYDLPQFEENYVHRIGRTARVSGEEGTYDKGTAITLVMKDQIRILARIEAFMNRKIIKRPLPPRYPPGDRRRKRRTQHKKKKHHRRNFLY